jgi:hypothetical protein
MGLGMMQNRYHGIFRAIIGCFIVFFSTVCISDCPQADLTGDCIVDISDLNILANNWLSPYTPQQSGLIAHWPLNESEGETATDTVGGHAGQIFGNAEWMPSEGSLQGALLFDGVDNYVEITSYKGIGGAAGRTCAAWIKTPGSNQNSVILSWGGNQWIFGLFTTGTLTIYTGGSYIQTSRMVHDNEWHHVAAVMINDGSPDVSEIRLYIDGVLQTTTAVPGAINTPLSNNMLIGAYSYPAPSAFFKGMLDDIRLYDQPLMDDEIMRLFATGTAERGSPDFTADDFINTGDLNPLSKQWLSEKSPVVISEFLASNGSASPPDAAQGQILDGDGDSSDWIELFNQSDTPINLGNWGLTDDQTRPFKWQFPAGTLLQGRSFLLVFASDKHPYTDPQGYHHTNFKLSASGEYLALTRPDGRIESAYHSVLSADTGDYGFPEQKQNTSYGMLYDAESYFSTPTPRQPNRQSFSGFVDAPDFSHERGFYEASFSLTLTTPTTGAIIRYTIDGTNPTLANGYTYTGPIPISASTGPVGRIIRAAAFKAGYVASSIKSKTYIMNATSAMKGLPAVCLAGSTTEVFYNPYGVMAIVGGAWGPTWAPINPTDYNNMLGEGMNYERPLSMEYFRPNGSDDFQEDCGLRVQGSAWIRPRYTPPSVTGIWSGEGKISLRLYFRSLYGESKFRHSVLEKFPEVDEIDTIVLRAGHNDRENPFVKDEMIRRLQYQMGHNASRGTFVNLYINGSYKGFFNLCEKIDEGFCQEWFNSDKEWDVVGWVQPGSYLEVKDGDAVAFNAFINYANTNNLTDPLRYAQIERQMDMTAYVDYIILQCWAANSDWPQNNWVATAERSEQRKWRFFVWDAEWAMASNSNPDRFARLSTDSSSLSVLFRALKVNGDFKILFTDRLQKHFLNEGGVLTNPNTIALFNELAGEVQSVISPIDTYVTSTFIPTREPVFSSQCIREGLFSFAAPGVFLNASEIKNGKEYALENSSITMQNAAGVSGDIYFTLDGTDPRLPLSDQSLPPVTLVAENAPKRVLVPTSNIGTTWYSQTAYDDSSWNDGIPADISKTGGVGYERNPGESTSNVPYISYNLESKMYNKYNCAYIRIPFTINAGDLGTWNNLLLKMRYDDGFVAYINGTEVCRGGISSSVTPAWDTTAPNRENAGLETFVISNYLNTLRAGQNILAIHGMNNSKSSTDFVISAILEASYSTNSLRISSKAQKYTSAVTLSKSAHIKARTLNGAQWGAIREAMISVGPLNENLRISEFMYHPNGDPNEEFVELTNIGTSSLNLNRVAFTHGIQYAFSDTPLQPGQYLLLVKNAGVFQNRYGAGLPVVGQYEGALENAGEKIQLSNIWGSPIQIVDYKDSWYELTDGDGFSLTAVNPLYNDIEAPQENLEARWAFNETDGITAEDQTGRYPGTLYNMQSTTRVAGHEDKALAFDGIDDYINISGYKGIGGTASRTCAAWIKTPGSTQNTVVMSWGGQQWIFGLFSTGKLTVFVGGPYIETAITVNNNQWHHVAAVLTDDGSPNVSEIKLYVDGILQTTKVNMPGAINTPATNDMLIGAFSTGTPGAFFNGVIDDARIYSRALDTGEIAILAGLDWSQKELWRPSAIRGGTPGRAETAQETLPLPGAIVINEILAHSHGDQLDWVELKNTTSQNISIGGWFISDAFDSDTNRKKYQIPAGVILSPANPYYVIEESQFNNGCRIPFALSEGGETLYLQSAQGEQLTGYFTSESFGATDTDVSLGRFQKSDGEWNFVPMGVKTQGAANAYPKVGPIIISEIMYNPGPNSGDQDYEYLELMNISAESVRTASLVSTYTSPTSHDEEWIPWRFTDAIEFEFPVDLQIAPNQRILFVKNRTAFDTRYTGVPTGTVIFQWTAGSLASEGETVQLDMPGDQEYLQDRYYIREDRVNYDDQSPWPTQADGTGKSLTHIRPTATGNNYTNDPVHWSAENPSPGW